MLDGDAQAARHDAGRQLLAEPARAPGPAAEPAGDPARAALREYRAWSAAGRPGAVTHAEARRLLLGEPG
jgi:hypothetical protein